jgi:hypothetical protein
LTPQEALADDIRATGNYGTSAVAGLGLLRLDVCRSDHLSPLLDFEGNLLPEFLWSVPDCVSAASTCAAVRVTLTTLGDMIVKAMDCRIPKQ